MLHDEDKLSTTHRHGYYGYGVYSHFEFGDFKLEPMLFAKENTRENLLYNSLNSYYAGARVYGDLGQLFMIQPLLSLWQKRSCLWIQC